MSQYDATGIPSREDVVDSLYGLLSADATLLAACTPGGVYLRRFPKTAPADGLTSWVWLRVLLDPDPGLPVHWDRQTRCPVLVQVETQRVSEDDNAGRRCEIIHEMVNDLLNGQKPLASMVLPFGRYSGPTTNDFSETLDRIISNAKYQTVIN